MVEDQFTASLFFVVAFVLQRYCILYQKGRHIAMTINTIISLIIFSVLAQILFIL
jgi:hypothetical protein